MADMDFDHVPTLYYHRVPEYTTYYISDSEMILMNNYGVDNTHGFNTVNVNEIYRQGND